MAPPPGPILATRHPFRLMQALEDAVVFRRARSTTPCADCIDTPGGWCDDHACDLDLIAGYQDDLAELDHALTASRNASPAARTSPAQPPHTSTP
jgi:hypothetical protein